MADIVNDQPIVEGGSPAPEEPQVPAESGVQDGDQPEGDLMQSLDSELAALFGDDGSSPTDQAGAEGEELEAEETEEIETAGEAESSDAEAEGAESTQDRIDSLTRDLADRDAEIAGLKAERDDSKQQVQQLSDQLAQGWQSNNALSHINTVDEIAAKRGELKEMREQLRGGLVDGMTLQGANGPVDLEPEQVKQALSQVEKQLEEDLPNRESFLANRQQFDGQAAKIWPDMFKKGSEMEKFAAQAWSNAPYLREAANVHVLIGVMWEGTQAIKAKQAATAKEQEKQTGKKPAPAAPKFQGKTVASKKAQATAPAGAGSSAGGGASSSEKGMTLEQKLAKDFEGF